MGLIAPLHCAVHCPVAFLLFCCLQRAATHAVKPTLVKFALCGFSSSLEYLFYSLSAMLLLKQKHLPVITHKFANKPHRCCTTLEA